MNESDLIFFKNFKKNNLPLFGIFWTKPQDFPGNSDGFSSQDTKVLRNTSSLFPLFKKKITASAHCTRTAFGDNKDH